VDILRLNQLVGYKAVNINWLDPADRITPLLLLCAFNQGKSLYECVSILLQKFCKRKEDEKTTTNKINGKIIR